MTASHGRSHLLLIKYFNLGWLERRYFINDNYMQPYSADDRLLAGKKLYADYSYWQRGCRITKDYSHLFVDVSPTASDFVQAGFAVERFRKALKSISKSALPVVYKIVLEEKEIAAPRNLSKREVLYFNDEIKGLLCRGLDEIVPLYAKAKCDLGAIDEVL